MSTTTISELDVVELAAGLGRWPAGTRGTVVAMLGPDTALVEIVGADGRTMDTVEVPLDALRGWTG